MILKVRARSELGLDGLVEQRVVRVVDDGGPVVAGEAHGKLVGVEAGARDHGEDLAGVRIQRDDGAVLAVERLLGGHLEVEVDGEPEVLAGDGERLALLADLLAVRVDDDVAGAVGTAQERVVGGLDAGLADDIAGRVAGIAVIVGEHLLGHLADVADEVGGETVAGVEAALLVAGFELGQLVAVRLDEGLLVGGDVLLERDGLVLGRGGVAPEDGFERVERDVQAAEMRGQVDRGVLDLLAQQVGVGAGVIVDQQPAFAVEDASARGEHGLLADAVGFGEHAVVVGAEHLQVPKAEHEHDQDEDDDVLRGVQLAGRELFFAVEEGSCHGVLSFGW